MSVKRVKSTKRRTSTKVDVRGSRARTAKLPAALRNFKIPECKGCGYAHSILSKLPKCPMCVECRGCGQNLMGCNCKENE